MRASRKNHESKSQKKERKIKLRKEHDSLEQRLSQMQEEAKNTSSAFERQLSELKAQYAQLSDHLSKVVLPQRTDNHLTTDGIGHLHCHVEAEAESLPLWILIHHS
jgi:hypothetical protein